MVLLPSHINIEYINRKLESYQGKNIYISAPITTGKDFVNWYIEIGKYLDKEEYRIRHFNEIIRTNNERIITFAKKIEIKEQCTVIEPASFVEPTWTQNDYLYFWGEIIKNYIKKIYFLGGWNFSNGCVYELYIGLVNNVSCVDENNNPILPDYAITQITDAIDVYKQNKIKLGLQEQILNELKKYENKY